MKHSTKSSTVKAATKKPMRRATTTKPAAARRRHPTAAAAASASDVKSRAYLDSLLERTRNGLQPKPRRVPKGWREMERRVEMLAKECHAWAEISGSSDFSMPEALLAMLATQMRNTGTARESSQRVQMCWTRPHLAADSDRASMSLWYSAEDTRDAESKNNDRAYALQAAGTEAWYQGLIKVPELGEPPTAEERAADAAEYQARLAAHEAKDVEAAKAYGERMTKGAA